MTTPYLFPTCIDHSLGSSVLGGQRTGEAALDVLRHHLDEPFGPASPASDSS
ncbi:hypothetical protein ACF07L_09985 [Streptomyces anulatus]|uniref:hypothetical protein n=1 Tax=Streptomyces anulatus TaxID=1892 RepID=UPI0036FFB4D7